jgi:hypothetical protein
MHDPLISETFENVGLKPTPNVDDFFTFLYKFYLKKNMKKVYCDSLKDVFDIFSVIMFGLILFVFTKWSTLCHCTSKVTCDELRLLSFSGTFTSYMLVILGIITVLVYAFYKWHETTLYLKTELFIKTLNIAVDDVSWDELIHILTKKHPKLQIGDDLVEYDVHDVTNIIMRHENIMISLLTTKKLPLFCVSRTLKITIFELFISSWLYTDKFDIKERLHKKIRLLASLYFIMMPFVLMYMFITLMVENVEDIRTRSATALFERRVQYGHNIMLRRFNELPHEYEERIKDLECICKEYIDAISSPITDLMISCVHFVSACSFLFILIISSANESILLYASWPFENQISLILWFAIVSTIVSISKKKNQKSHNAKLSLENIKRKLAFDNYSECYDLKKVFPMQIFNIFHEFLDCLISPIIIVYYFPKILHEILEFFEEAIVKTSHGHMIKHALFKTTPETTTSTYVNEKIKRSLQSFCETHPNWMTNLNDSEKLVVENMYDELLSQSLSESLYDSPSCDSPREHKPTP